MDFSEYAFLSNLNWGQIIFFAFLSIVNAIFYTAIIREIFEIVHIPFGLLFALFPSLILVTGIISLRLAFFVFLFIFVSTFMLIIVGTIYREINNSKRRVKNNLPKTPSWKIIIRFVEVIAAITAFFYLGPYVFLLIISYSLLKSIVKKKSSSTFFKLQSILPTSKIRSIAMGLVELEGSAKMITPIISRIGKKECIAYTYKIERIERDKDGRNSYFTISHETVCNPFLLEDETGSVEVTGENIELINLEKSDAYNSSGKRYTQSLFLNNTNIILIGKANTKNQKIRIEKEAIKDIFALAPTLKVNFWNKYQPLRQSLKIYASLFAIGIALILLMNFTYHKENDVVSISFELMDASFNLKNFLDIINAWKN